MTFKKFPKETLNVDLIKKKNNKKIQQEKMRFLNEKYMTIKILSIIST